MFKFLVKLLVAALIANAAWRAGSVYLNFFRFEDKVLEAAQFRGSKSNEALKQRVLELAEEFDIAMTEDSVSVELEDRNTVVDGMYSKPVELFPGFTYAWPFTIHISAPTPTALR